MTQPGPIGETQRAIEAGVTEKDDFDETSDLCDFGYVLATGLQHHGPDPAGKRGRDNSA